MTEQVFYEIARWRLDEQLTQARELNSRLAGLFTAATALLVLLAAFQTIDIGKTGATELGLLIAGGSVYVLLVLAAFSGYLERQLSLAPNLEDLRDLSGTIEDEVLREWAAAETMRAIIVNEARITFKRRMTTIATALWAIDVLLFAAAAVASAL